MSSSKELRLLSFIIFENPFFPLTYSNYVFFNPLQGEIRATGFNDVVDKFYDLLEVNKVCILWLEIFPFCVVVEHIVTFRVT